ncbi:MAG: hypothetical protein A3F12_01970 [Gammaproteobacteria bacterium RIFCSPHIGHO2_12_FULL_38_14]|nr:MAG: hypothetical protein A3F12_01970 [Gammaproteobacteria bacterium RIFCSPHIGHO2_12_FULL_38_14]
MPEMLTKYPESAFIVLKSAGAKCGVGAEQKILIHCPKEDFCALPHGEICVYSLKDVGNMTQIAKYELSDAIGNIPTIYSNINIFFLVLSCLFGMLMAFIFKRK